MKNIFGNFKNRLYGLFAIILLIPILSVGALSYNSAKQSLENQILFSAKGSVETVNELIDQTINAKKVIVDAYGKELNVISYGYEDRLRDSFTQAMKLSPDISNIYVATATGDFFVEPNVNVPPGFNPTERDWYKEAVAKKGDILITQPYLDTGTGNMVVTIARQIADQSGVIGIDIQLTDLKKITGSISIGKKGYPAVFGQENLIITHPTLEPGKPVEEAFMDKIYASDSGTFDYVFKNEQKILTFVTNETTGWKVTGTLFSQELDDAASPILWTTIIVLVIAIVLSIIIIYFVMKAIIRPINRLKDSAVTISNGDLTETVAIQSNDEIGQLGQAFNDMQGNLRDIIQKIEFNAEEVASSAEQLTANATQTTTATERVAISIQDVATSAETQTINATKNAESLHELSTAIHHIAEIAGTVTDLSQHATIQANEGGQAIQNTKNQMQSIHVSVTDSNAKIQSLYERSQQITSILDVITGIADQTNLLALNAAIEAARAGEQGKGFAVVADEVRKLAEQSQASARQIFDLIHSIQEETEQSVGIMSKVAEDVQHGLHVSEEAITKFYVIMDSMNEITPKMEEVSSAAEQMSASVEEVAMVTENLATSASNNANASEEVAASTEEQLASMEEINASAHALAHMADELKQLVNQFKY
ncbi:methyl-accepting chemotaxis protein [Lysinibacillus piscis]|uniref:Methyl-accepting chemotaxis protein n=1 Tax=Lysinibacillus piscis TaxID=2518931 RepID=A0ABQ5NLS5_9BACI|nr:methyl-accepting chemotaxis protein [Lysinibacillus sp. KH24]GLC89304.1 putative methyl-accepting chemotaxis protein [Lysinibacillus sp. KH24]